MARHLSQAFLATAVALATLAISPVIHAHKAKRVASAPRETVDQAACKPLGVDPKKVNDHRGRASSDWMKFQFEDNWNSHTGPAVERMQTGEYSHRVMADLAFTLWVWPNHVRALQALIDYTVAGGKSYEFMPAECYFVHAKRFYNDDINVHMLEGLFYWKMKQFKHAKESYQNALAIDKDSVDAHYNLGLMCLELKEYDEALSHAHVAYRAGYPLSGLRKRLEAAGQWRDETPGSTPQPNS